MGEQITINLTEGGEEISVVLNEAARGATGAPGSDAEVTTANVRAAGALMDDEVTNLAQVKAFSSADYATAAQGLLADTAIQEEDLAVVAFTGDYDDLSSKPDLSGLQNQAFVVSANQTAVNSAVYHNVATATYTDPTPAEGKGFDVLVINGTATVGGTGYGTAGTLIKRRWHSGSWQTNYVYLNKAQMDALYLATNQFTTNKASIADGDKFAFLDSAASDAPKHGLWSLIKSTLKTYFDTLYVALTGNQTIAGNKTFSGQTELTGQAATNGTSAMNRDLGDLRYLASPDVVISGGDLENDFATKVWNQGAVTGTGSTIRSPQQIRANTGATTGSKAYIRMGSNYALIFCSGEFGALGINFDDDWVFSLRATINGAATNTDGYIVWGLQNTNTSTAQPSTKSFGLRSHDGTVYGFVHDGSTYTESSLGLSMVGVTNRCRKYSFVRTSTTLQFYVDDVLSATLTSPTGSTGNGYGTIGLWADNETSTADFTISIEGQIKFSLIQ